MGGPGSGVRKPTIYPAYARPEPSPPPKPTEYQLVDLLQREDMTEEVSEAIRLLLPFIAKQRRLAAIAAEESELAAIRHDLERVMTRENLYLNALMEITGLEDKEAVRIAADALYGENRRGRIATESDAPDAQPKAEALPEPAKDGADA